MSCMVLDRINATLIICNACSLCAGLNHFCPCSLMSLASMVSHSLCGLADIAYGILIRSPIRGYSAFAFLRCIIITSVIVQVYLPYVHMFRYWTSAYHDDTVSKYLLDFVRALSRLLIFCNITGLSKDTLSPTVYTCAIRDLFSCSLLQFISF